MLYAMIRNHWRLLALVFFPLFVWSMVYADEYTSSSYRVLDPAMNPGGFATSSNYQLWSSVSEVAVGTSSSAAYQNGGGFLRFPYAERPVVVPTAGDGSVSLSWSAVTGYGGWTVTSYSVGVATTPGGAYSYTNVGNTLTYPVTGLTSGVPYYFVVVANDFFGNGIATSTEVTETPVNSNIFFSLSTNSIYFGSLSTSQTKYGSSTNTIGDVNEVEGNNLQAVTSAAGGYSIYVQGQPLTSVEYPSITIDPLLSNTAPSNGQEQFGIRAVASGGSGTVSVPYAASGFAYAASATTSSQVASLGTADNATTTYSLRYMSNISPVTEAGHYQAALVYTMTVNF
jgi:hypothetical protein